MGHLKPGVTPAQASADLNSIGSYLEKTYPKDDGKMLFTLARPSLYGDYLGRPVRAFMTGLMLLAGLILLAACANLGSLFAARAADRSREVALRLALGSTRRRILAATLYRSGADFSGRRGAGTAGWRGAVAWSERVAAFSQMADPRGGESGCKCVWGGFAADSSQRIPLWRGTGKAGTAHQCV